jgi:hypothetical protein
MLTTGRNYHLDYQDELDFIHNYYERLVIEAITEQSERVQQGDRDFLADVACVALNRLPPRYIRHDVDMTFFMSPQDIKEIGDKVANAVSDALNYVESRERGEDAKLATVDVSLAGTRATKPVKTNQGTGDSGNEKPKSAKAKGSKKKS